MANNASKKTPNFQSDLFSPSQECSKGTTQPFSNSLSPALIHSYNIHRPQIPGFFSRRIPGMQCYLPQPDLLVPGPTAVLLELVGSSRVNSWDSLFPVNTQ